jgi:hypothetical protein
MAPQNPSSNHEIERPDLARQYLADLESMAREGRRSKDLRVLFLALRVIAMQSATIQKLFGRI